jgi:hypothetical protein
MTIPARKHRFLCPQAAAVVQFLKIRSGTSAAPVNQASGATLGIVVN